jgi:hypothetical protein
MWFHPEQRYCMEHCPENTPVKMLVPESWRGANSTKGVELTCELGEPSDETCEKKFSAAHWDEKAE